MNQKADHRLGKSREVNPGSSGLAFSTTLRGGISASLSRPHNTLNQRYAGDRAAQYTHGINMSKSLEGHNSISEQKYNEIITSLKQKDK